MDITESVSHDYKEPPMTIALYDYGLTFQYHYDHG